MTRRIVLGAVFALTLLVPVGLGTASGQPTGRKAGDAPQKGEQKAERGPARAAHLQALLGEIIDMKEFQAPMSLKEVLYQIQDKVTTRYKGGSLPILVDTEAFKDENPEGPDVYDTQVLFVPFPRWVTVATALRVALSRVPTRNATYVVRRGLIEITTQKRVAPRRLLKEMVQARFDRRPLDEALEELAELTGASIVLDARVGEKGKTPVTATFRHTATLEAAVKLLAEMAGLEARVDDQDVLFVTQKRKASGELRLRDCPLSEALRELAHWSGSTIVLDPRAESTKPPAPPSTVPAKQPVSAIFKKGTSPEAAARILADMTGLTVVALDNALYVTTADRARQLKGREGGSDGGRGRAKPSAP